MRTLTGVLLTILASAAAQTPDAPPQFEVASIKIAPPPDGRGMRVSSRGGPGTKDPTLFTCENCELSGLVSRAYDLKRYEYSGPDWTHEARFHISAKIPEGATKEQFRQMLQNLLADRFKLTFHREKKDVPGYDLVVAKNGPKFKESEPVPIPDEEERRSAKPTPLKQGEDHYPVLPAGRESTMAVMRGYASQRFGNETMELLAQHLAFQSDKPVNDATGLKGKYDFSLHWVMDGMAEETGPNLFLAIQEQLGLKLESKKTQIDVFVVDHIEKVPTEN